MSDRPGYQGHDNSQWHMLPKAAQRAWREYARRNGERGLTSDAFAAGVWWCMTHALKEAAALVKDKEQGG